MWCFVCSLAMAGPTVEPPRGLYEAPVELTVTPTEGGAVWYSADGSEPTLPWPGTLIVDRTRLLRFVEQLADGSISDTVAHTYVYVDQLVQSAVMDPTIVGNPLWASAIEDSLRTLPVVSVAAPGGLDLYEEGGSVEWIDPDGASDGVECGVHTVGGTSWVYPKNSIRLNFRSAYGPSRWEFDVYGADVVGVPATTSFDAITLRSGNHDTMYYLGTSGQHLRNRWIDETQREMGHVMPHGRPAHVLLNGVYHGVYHVRERFAKGFLEAYYGGSESDYEVWTGSYLEDGSGAAWTSAQAAATDWPVFSTLVDTEQYLDYMVMMYYAGNSWDWWPWHNWMTGGPSDASDRGGLTFHSNDCDICLYYEPDVDITYLYGPQDVFLTLLSTNDPDFRVAFADAVHRNLEAGGPLVAERAGLRYEALADEIGDAILAESARWGDGWWDREGDWIPERDRLLDTWFPVRTAEVLDQFRSVGWIGLPAPVFDVDGGEVLAGTVLTLLAPPGAELWWTSDGADPRLAGGAVAPTAQLGASPLALAIDRSVDVAARIKVGAVWGPVHRERFVVDEPVAVLVNEWNAVEPGKVPAEGDAALGFWPGNGGDWVEFVVTSAVDLRGWRLEMEDWKGAAGEIRFTDDPLLAALPAGTLLTVAEDLAEDAAFDPSGGDWRFHLRAGSAGSGQYVEAADFDVTPLGWTAVLRDAQGVIRYGPVGEGVEPRDGIGSEETGCLTADPSASTRAADESYAACDRSSYGYANEKDGEIQDLTALRGAADPWVTEGTVDAPATTAAPVAPGTPAPTEPVPEAPDIASVPQGAASCGCATGAWTGSWFAWVLVLAACRRENTAPPGATVGTPATPSTAGPPPTTPATTPTGVEGPTAACFVDADRDGHGGDLPSACDVAGTSPSDDDCDDDDPSRFPGAPETCDGVDQDCDDVVDPVGGVVDGLPFFADADGDGVGGATVLACALGEGTALVGGDCDDDDPSRAPGLPEDCNDGIDQDCDGVDTDGLGGAENCPASTCLEIADQGGAVSGPSWLLLPSGTVANVWCDQDSDGGGWTLGLLRNSASVGNQGDFGAGEVETEGLATDPASASASGAPIMSWLDLNGFSWTELVVGSALGGATAYRSRPIPRSDIRTPFGADGYKLYGESGYYWCGGWASYTDLGIGAVNNPAGAPADCKGHGGLGSGWDFSESAGVNAGLTLCGADASNWMYGGWATGLTYYGTVGAAQAIWVR